MFYSFYLWETEKIFIAYIGTGIVPLHVTCVGSCSIVYVCNNIDVLIMVHVRISEILHSFPFFITTANFLPFFRVGYETQGPSPRCRAECRARIISIQSKYNLPDKVQCSKISYPS